MKVTVKLGDIEITVDSEEAIKSLANKPSGHNTWGKDALKDAIIPLLEKTTEKAKELHDHSLKRFR